MPNGCSSAMLVSRKRAERGVAKTSYGPTSIGQPTGSPSTSRSLMPSLAASPMTTSPTQSGGSSSPASRRISRADSSAACARATVEPTERMGEVAAPCRGFSSVPNFTPEYSFLTIKIAEREGLIETRLLRVSTPAGRLRFAAGSTISFHEMVDPRVFLYISITYEGTVSRPCLSISPCCHPR